MRSALTLEVHPVVTLRAVEKPTSFQQTPATTFVFSCVSSKAGSLRRSRTTKCRIETFLATSPPEEPRSAPREDAPTS
jgi:hypothetical protein